MIGENKDMFIGGEEEPEIREMTPYKTTDWTKPTLSLNCSRPERKKFIKDQTFSNYSEVETKR